MCSKHMKKSVVRWMRVFFSHMKAKVPIVNQYLREENVLLFDIYLFEGMSVKMLKNGMKRNKNRITFFCYNFYGNVNRLFKEVFDGGMENLILHVWIERNCLLNEK